MYDVHFHHYECYLPFQAVYVMGQALLLLLLLSLLESSFRIFYGKRCIQLILSQWGDWTIGPHCKRRPPPRRWIASHGSLYRYVNGHITRMSRQTYNTFSMDNRVITTILPVSYYFSIRSYQFTPQLLESRLWINNGTWNPGMITRWKNLIMHKQTTW